MLRQLAPLFTLALIALAPARIEPIDAEVNARIRAEGLERSRLPWLTHHLTDLYGPRLTGTPALEAAGRWAIETMESWGLQNGHMDPWDWGHEGWRNERAVGHIVEPVQDRLEFEVIGWTPSTNGTVRTEAVNLVVPGGPAGPTDAELTAYLDSIASRGRDRIVLGGAWVPVPVDFRR
jgi:hypothetical protein